MKRVSIIGKPKQAAVTKVTGELLDWFRKKGLQATVDPSSDQTAQSDLVVVVGGDGTLLSAVRQIGDRPIPILAINHGSLGFLTEVTLDEMYPALEQVLAGKFVTEQRMKMEVDVLREGTTVANYNAFNDAVINKGTLARIIELEARVNGQLVSSFRSDGIIVSTPTGSTAYNLSAGGPIIFPSMRAMAITPICSHTLTNRPIVLPPEVTIEITLKSEQDEVQLTVDGQVGDRLNPEDCVRIRRSKTDVQLIAPSGKDYFDVLRGKLKWG